MRRVKIVQAIPNAKNGYETNAKLWNGVQADWPTIMNQFSQKDVSVNNTLQPVDREDANLEAEKGEHAIVNQGGIPTNFKIAGKPHTQGGTPLNLPDNSFIFSKTKDMRIKDPVVLAQFGLPAGTYTPADIAKKYDLNKYRQTLADKDSSELNRKTAEMMISNYNLKLAKLGLVQESKKGFPQGIPSISMPYVEGLGINPDDFLTTQSQQEQPSPDMMTAAYGGYLPMAQAGLNTDKFISDIIANKKPEVPDWKSQLKVLQSPEHKVARELKEYNEYYNTGKSGILSDMANELESAKKLAANPPKGMSQEYAFEQLRKADINYKNMLNNLSKYKTQEEYQASLLQPFTPEKKQAQLDWNIAHSEGYKDIPEENVISPIISDTTGLAAFKAKKEYGGTLDQYDGGGKVTKKDATFVQYEDGSIKNIKTGTWVEHAKPGWKPSTTTAKTIPSKLDVFTPEFTEALTKRYKQDKLTPEQIKHHMAFDVVDEKGNVIPERMVKTVPGMQGTRKSGTFGEQDWWDQTYKPDFIRRHQPLLDKYKQETGKDWDPTNLDTTVKGKPTSSAIQWFEKEYNKEAKDKGLPAYNFGDPGKLGSLTYHAPSLSDFEQPADAEKKGALADEGKKKAAALATTQQQGPDPWWLQDIIKTAGAASDFFGVKKYSPWQATPGVTLPEPTFYDPNRELAANAEMANIGTQGAATFNNPQAFAANFSQIQGQAGKNAADILSKYNNMNVGVANSFEQERTNIQNNAAANRAGLATQLADKYTILNQQFDNSKNMARQNLRQSYIDAVTNKNYTGNLNDLYDQYKIDPMVGGRIKWTNGRPLVADETPAELTDKINKTAIALSKNAGVDPKEAMRYAVQIHTGQGATQHKGNGIYDQGMGQ